MVQTVDFFTPVVDDPFVFGQIAAANAISDVYAMGAEPAMALAVAAFPTSVLPLEVLGEIFRGGADKAREAGIEIAGGHSVDYDVPSYGLAVTGFVAEKDLWRNTGLRIGDEIVLSKALGTGVLTSAYRAVHASGAARILHAATHGGARFDPADLPALIASMTTLNRSAAEAARGFPVRAATDVTGYGLAGHLHEMAENSGLSVEIRMENVPFLSGAIRVAEAGIAPTGSRKNLLSAGRYLSTGDGISESRKLLLCDAQTNGCLLVAVPPGEGESLARAMRQAGSADAAVVARALDGPAGSVRLVA